MKNLDVKKLVLHAPITTWDEAIPLGNGITGVLLWGSGKKIKISIDRGDLWDERINGGHQHPDWNRKALEEIVAAKSSARLTALDKVYEAMFATKLPVGRLEITFKEEQDIATFELDMAKAIGLANDSRGHAIIQCFCAADMSAIHLKIENAKAVTLKIVPPDYQGQQLKADGGSIRTAASLGYPPAITKESDNLNYYIQPCMNGLHYGIFLKRISPCEWALFIRKAISRDEMNHIIGEYENIQAQYPSFGDALKTHLKWWNGFWAKSKLKVPNKAILQYYNLCRYFYGSASRIGAPPMPLQAVWTADDNALPPWRGDYHHDLNTQMSYAGYLTSGDFDSGRCFFDHLYSQIDIYRKFAKSYYNCNGIAVPGTATLAGQSLGGWQQYSLSPTNSAWLATMFTDHYKFTADSDFLLNKAWPFVSGVGEFIVNMLKTDKSGKYYLPLSTSPEIHDGNIEAFLTPTSNYDLALIKRLFIDLIFISDKLGDNDSGTLWRNHYEKLSELSVDNEVGLMLSPDEILRESHRHHSHMIAIYPMRLLNMKNHEELINKTFRHLDRLGTGEWVAFGFVWSAAMSAYCGKGERALRMLEIFIDGFISRNGFCLNGDYKDYGYSWWKYRPFTIETNFLAMQAVHEMLLQSHGGEITIFPALPSAWNDVEFQDLRGEGGIHISAKLKRGMISWIKIYAQESCHLKLVNPRRSIEKLCQTNNVDFSKDVWEFNLTANNVLVFK